MCVLLHPLQLSWATCTDSASPGTRQTTESSLPSPTSSRWSSSKRRPLSRWLVMDTSQRKTAFWSARFLSCPPHQNGLHYTFQELEKLGVSADNLRLKAVKYVMEEMSNIDWKQMSKLDQLMEHFWQAAKEARMVRLRIKWKDNIGRLWAKFGHRLNLLIRI